MQLHANAALTVAQRVAVRRLHHQDHVSIRELARRFHVNPTTIQRWVGRASPLDRTTAPRQHATVITPDYHAAVVAYRQAHPRHGPVRIAAELHPTCPHAHRGTVLKILQQEGLTRPTDPRRRVGHPIPVGRHRLQLDIQQLPAVQGQRGFEYKISAIHLKTRLKYSEIVPRADTAAVLGVFQRALDRLPPFS